VFDLMSLKAGPGDELELEISGDDAPAAMQQFLELFSGDFFPHAAGT
jgi:phosphotransferase system HPr-like phosphotransfer protein